MLDGVRGMNRNNVVSKFKHFNISNVGALNGALNGSTSIMIHFVEPLGPQLLLLR